MNRPRRRPRGRLLPRLPAAPAPVGVAAEAGEEATHGSGRTLEMRAGGGGFDFVEFEGDVFGVAAWLWIRGESDRCRGGQPGRAGGGGQWPGGVLFFVGGSRSDV